jgi:hypothetical protein
MVDLNPSVYKTQQELLFLRTYLLKKVPHEQASQTPSQRTRTWPTNSTALTESPRLAGLPTLSRSLANPIACDQTNWLGHGRPRASLYAANGWGTAVAASTIYC